MFMTERDRYIPGVPCWADSTQPDPDAAAEFYGGIFGWEFEDKMPPGSGSKYLEATIGGRMAAAISSGAPGAAPTTAKWNTYVWVENADETAAKVRDAGGEVTAEAFDVMGAGRMASFTDREDAAISVWQPYEHRGAQVVNEHGGVNFNDLNTRDVDAAKEFYGAVFGWDLLELGPGMTMFTLPGYGDFLEEINPGTKERNQELGAPEGFADVVASVMPIGEDRAPVEPHWSITFGVDDADPVAAKAEELGGTIVMPPTDLPWVKATVITDPGGATFTASQFKPENR